MEITKEGLPRLLEVFERRKIKATSHMVGAAVDLHPALAKPFSCPLLPNVRCGFFDQSCNLLWPGDVDRVAGAPVGETADFLTGRELRDLRADLRHGASEVTPLARVQVFPANTLPIEAFG
jgi:hypothetical protein